MSDDRIQEQSFTGEFEIASLEPGEWILTAHGPGDSRSLPKPVRVPQDDVTIVLPRAAAIRGTVVQPDGEPLPGAAIFEETVWLPPFLQKPRAHSSSGGEFGLDGLPPGRVVLRASHPDHCDSGETEVVVEAGKTAEVQLKLTRGGRVSGRVDTSQAPVEFRQVHLYSLNGNSGWKFGRTDAAGAFTFDHVIPQDYIIDLKPPDGESRPSIRKRVTVKVGETLEVVLGENPGGIKIEGRVLCGDAPEVNVRIQIFPTVEEGEPGGDAHTDFEGRFTASVLHSGPHVFVIDNAYRIERKAEDLTIQVPAGTVSGVVLSEDGSPVHLAGVTLVRTGEEDLYARYRRLKTRADGSFEFRMLDPGTWVLRVPEGFQQDRPAPRTPHGRIVGKVTVGDGPVEKKTLRLPREGRIAGQVVDSLGRPATAWIAALDEKGVPQSGDWETMSDASGWFEILSLAPGIYTLEIAGKDVRTRSEPVKVEAGRTAEVTVRLT